jgi:hypothetical protein
VGPGSARVAVLAVRSGGESGYIGVAGESWVPQVQIAEGRLDVAPFEARFGRLWATGGLIDDPFVVEGLGAWGLRPLAPVMAEEQALLDRSDTGLGLGWGAPGSWVDLRGSVLSGEGLAARERNEGQNVTGMLTVRPLAFWEPEVLQISLMVRDGSRGVLKAPDHRTGVRVWGRHPWVAGGAELLQGEGQLGDGSLRPRGSSVWVRAGDSLPAVGWLRWDQALADRERSETALSILRLGGGPTFGPPGARRAFFLAAGLEKWSGASASGPIAGTAPDRTVVFLQMGSQLMAGLPFELAEPTARSSARRNP